MTYVPAILAVAFFVGAALAPKRPNRRRNGGTK
jgi:hypothetical protein